MVVVGRTVGVYIPIIRIPIKGGMTIPNIGSLDCGTVHLFSSKQSPVGFLFRLFLCQRSLRFKLLGVSHKGGGYHKNSTFRRHI